MRTHRTTEWQNPSCAKPLPMALFGSNGETNLFDWTIDPSYNDQWSFGPPQSSTSVSSSGPDEELRAILTMDQVHELPSLASPEPLVRDRDENWAPVEPIQAQTQTTPRRLMSDASWDAVRQRRTEQRHTSSSSSNPQAGTSSGPWRPWNDRPPTTQNVPSASGPSSTSDINATSSLYIPPDHKIAPFHPSEPTNSRILELLNSMNQPSSALPSKGGDDGGAQEEEEDPTALSAFTCPVCFCPPENATLTPCGHVMCTFSHYK
jgi:hypothetical protein